MTVTELRREAAKLGIEGRSKVGKASLIRAVSQKRRSSSH
jgi:GTP-binding protein EngB required for normal cell division